MRHSAAISLKFDDGKPLRFYISSGGDQPTIRTALRLAVRGRRRVVRRDPEVAAMAVLGFYIKDTVPPTFRPRDNSTWSYRIDFTSIIPTVYITHPSGDTTSVGLFEWIGPELKHLSEKPHAPRSGKKQARRGRPSILQTNEEVRRKLSGVQVPDRVDPILGPIYKKK